MRISLLAKKTGVSIRSLRYYEQKELISSKRLPNGYREFDEDVIAIVKMIQLYLSLGLNTEQISNLLRCQDLSSLPNQKYICDSALMLYEEKRKEISQQIEILEGIRNRLEKQICTIRYAQVTEDKQKNDESGPLYYSNI